MSQRHDNRGFSLLELVVVISIIALLAGALVPRVSNRMAAARDTRRLQDIQTVRGAVEQYFEDHGSYPAANTNASFGGWDVSQDGDFVTELLETGYLTDVVADPLNDNTHHYRYYVYNQGSYSCVGPGDFYVLGIRNFETQEFAAKNAAFFECTNRNWGNEFDWVCGGGATKK